MEKGQGREEGMEKWRRWERGSRGDGEGQG